MEKRIKSRRHSLSEAGTQQLTPVTPKLTLLTGPCPGLLNLCLLVAGSFPQLTHTVVGDTIAAAYWGLWGVLTARTHTLPS